MCVCVRLGDPDEKLPPHLNTQARDWQNLDVESPLSMYHETSTTVNRDVPNETHGTAEMNNTDRTVVYSKGMSNVQLKRPKLRSSLGCFSTASPNRQHRTLQHLPRHSKWQEESCEKHNHKDRISSASPYLTVSSLRKVPLTRKLCSPFPRVQCNTWLSDTCKSSM